MDRRMTSGLLGAFLGVIVTAVIVEVGFYLFAEVQDKYSKAGYAELACIFIPVLAPLGGLCGYFIGRRIGYR